MRAGVVAAAGPVEALPFFSLVEVVVGHAVDGEGGVDDLRHGLALQVKAQAQAPVGVEHVSHVAELVDGGQELRIKTQTLAVPGIGHPLAAFLAQDPGQLALQELLDVP